MRTKNLLFILLLFATLGVKAQEINSKADKYFYSYAYKEAIAEYKKDLDNRKEISNLQFLNLADAYFNTGDYKNASEIYVDIHRKDSVMSNHRFNKMLQSLAKTSEMERVRAFLKTKSNSLSTELIENATFNFNILESTSVTSDFNIFNLSSNSPQSDFSPAYYKDKLLFSSGRPEKSKEVYGPSGESYLDIYVARIGRDGNVVNPNVFDKMPASKYHKATPFYSNKSKKIYYILSNSEDGQLSFNDKGKNALAIGMVYESGFFAFLLKDLSTSFYYPFFDEVNDRLYFAANFENGYGGTDLYYVSTNNGQIMSQPINLGPRINSPGNEIAPYILDNSLYFSSDIFYGLGGMDVYKSNIRQDKSFSIPINLGSGINTEKDEFGFIIRGDEQLGYSGYFASNRAGGKGGDDIYGFGTRSALGPETVSIRGEVVEPKYQQGIAGATVKLMASDGTIIRELSTKADGKYLIEIPSRDQVVLQITKNRYSSFYQSFSGESLKALQETPLVFEMVSIEEVVTNREEMTVLDVPDFFFSRGSSTVTADVALVLDQVVSALQKFPQIQLQIETHTDSRGGSSTNRALSQRRADAIKKYLVSKGVASLNIISAKGFGEDRIMNNCTNGVYCLDFLHKQNLRTLFIVQNYSDLK